MKAETSILLPAAGVDLFLKDKETIQAARALGDDWRFARVAIRVREGGADEAIAVYAKDASPQIVMIETDTTDDSFVAKLEELSGHCSEQTSAVVIGPVNDVNLYRKLTAMGVSDYLVRPVPIETLSDVIATTLIEKLGTAGSRLVAMIGSKGGVGVSVLAQALAWGVSETLNEKTFLLDAAGAWSSLGVGIGFEPSTATSEAIKAVVAKDSDSFRRILYQANDRLSVLATGAEAMLDVTPQIGQFEEIINMAMTSYPLVIADLSGAPVALRKAILTRAHEIIVVSTPTLPALRSARTLIQEIKKLQGGAGGNIDLVVNMTGIAPGKEVAKGDIKAALDIEPSASFAFDPKLFIAAESEGRKLSADKAGQEVVSRLLPLVQKLVGKDAAVGAQEAGGLGTLLSRIKLKK